MATTTQSRTLLNSRKFVAYCAGELTWKLILAFTIWGIFTHNEGKMTLLWMGVLMAIIFTAGFVQVGYILGQAWIDRYTQGFTRIVGHVTGGKPQLDKGDTPSDDDNNRQGESDGDDGGEDGEDEGDGT